MTFHSLCSRSAHGGRLGARLGGGLGEAWGGFQLGGKGQEAREKNKWGQAVLHPGSHRIAGESSKHPCLTSQKSESKIPIPGPTLA